MKQSIEVDIPDGYEYTNNASPALFDGVGCVSVMFKKKQTKTFDFYVDEYLRSDDCTTNDMLCNWIPSNLLPRLKDNLKQNKLQFVPWEVRIGLVKFICKDKGLKLAPVLYNIVGCNEESSETDKLKQIISNDFLESLVR